ncbi:hypothetical protein GGQ80_001252 [Sphingomonas jinjuensis]|uniref:PepSY domain-containing protein n=1 Tax=Sphingomonas jinjuensis TaxID=535907 RepID=A0A840F617_9SPHN|nr:hypothetical protein [Sphingomonas jinjuensis]MBB4153350.1 hypothetical protein [Sphingomonas jinjuensis]
MFNAQTMKQVRRVHLYIGMFFTPAILLFSLSGALQTFRLQEEKGYGGTTPAWIVWMASVHKDSSLPRDRGAERPKKRPMAESPRQGAAARPAKPASSRLPMQIFVALLSIGLIVSALLGAIIAINSKTTRRASVIMLVAGTIVPLALMVI